MRDTFAGTLTGMKLLPAALRRHVCRPAAPDVSMRRPQEGGPAVPSSRYADDGLRPRLVVTYMT